MSKKITYKGEKEMPPFAISEGHMNWNKTGAWSYVNPVHMDNLSPCNYACPAGEDIQGYIQLVLKKKYREAWEKIRETNPLPSVCGRVCYHPCEHNCNRKDHDEAVSIHYIERFIGDWGLKNAKVKRLKTDPSKGEVAVIGAGPAGLSCAYHLIRAGHLVTIFDSMPKAGGMLRIGIPEYRLPRKILDAEIKSILDLGIKFVPRTEIGIDLPFSELNKFAATFIAVGAHKSKRMGIPGEDISGILPGLTFLRDVNFGKRPKLRGKVAVIGGGNTAIDVARCVLRLGGKPLILYRRSYEEMPAIREEIHEAEHEGIEIQFLTAPLEIRKRGRMLSLTTQKMKLGGKDSSGRRRPVPVKGSEITTPYSMVITAIGEDPNIAFLPEDLRHESWGIETDETQRTSMDEVFAGGDAGIDKRAVTDAIGAGHRAATAISQHLAGKDVAIQKIDLAVTHLNDLRLDYFDTSRSVNKKKISDAVRLKSFREVNIGLGERDAEAEANRCFSCGVCNSCDNCWIFCPDIAISRSNGKYTVNYDYCKGCGICVNECPRSAIHLEVKQVDGKEVK